MCPLRIVLFADTVFLRKFYLFVFSKKNWICRLVVSLLVEKFTLFHFFHLFMFLGSFAVNQFNFYCSTSMVFTHEYIISVSCS